MKRKTVTIQQRPNGLYSWYSAPLYSCIMAVYKGEGIGEYRLEHELNQYNINAGKFWNQHMIFQAVEWVRNWVKQ